MQDNQWIPIGCGSERSELEEVVDKLEDLWAERWAYRIEEAEDVGTTEEQFRLLVRHL
ncbi:MAG: hypothetical protein ACI9WU_005474 [Myxococcota bacterium]|jgi:hypothetical protein